jgi:hypothetical protein
LVVLMIDSMRWRMTHLMDRRQQRHRQLEQPVQRCGERRRRQLNQADSGETYRWSQLGAVLQPTLIAPPV